MYSEGALFFFCLPPAYGKLLDWTTANPVVCSFVKDNLFVGIFMNTNVKKISAVAIAGLMMGLTAAPVYADHHEAGDKTHSGEHDSDTHADESCSGEGCGGDDASCAGEEG